MLAIIAPSYHCFISAKISKLHLTAPQAVCAQTGHQALTGTVCIHTMDRCVTHHINSDNGAESPKILNTESMSSRLVAQGDFTAYRWHKSFKSYTGILNDGIDVSQMLITDTGGRQSCQGSKFFTVLVLAYIQGIPWKRGWPSQELNIKM
jgi:hypothetical protein